MVKVPVLLNKAELLICIPAVPVHVPVPALTNFTLSTTLLPGPLIARVAPAGTVAVPVPLRVLAPFQLKAVVTVRAPVTLSVPPVRVNRATERLPATVNAPESTRWIPLPLRVAPLARMYPE